MTQPAAHTSQIQATKKSCFVFPKWNISKFLLSEMAHRFDPPKADIGLDP